MTKTAGERRDTNAKNCKITLALVVFSRCTIIDSYKL
jgi:hypothetical protein